MRSDLLCQCLVADDCPSGSSSPRRTFTFCSFHIFLIAQGTQFLRIHRPNGIFLHPAQSTQDTGRLVNRRNFIQRLTGSLFFLAYTHYSFFEWGLIFLDILYDSVAQVDLDDADLHVCSLHHLCPEPPSTYEQPDRLVLNA
jgi:hypothetical protein